MSHHIKHSSIAALIALAGCSVLTIDVDVYKGPLANQKEVQIEQLAVMALGAKPLLVSLRDRMEDDYRAERDYYIEEESWYRPSYIPQAKTAEDEFESWPNLRLRTVPGMRINAVLGLYEDLPKVDVSAGHTERVARASELLEEYEIAYAWFIEDPSSDLESWKSLGLCPREEQADKQLFDWYSQLIHPVPTTWRSAKLSQIVSRWGVDSDGLSEQFAGLEGNAELVRADAKALAFQRPRGEHRKLFAQRVDEIASSFRTLREVSAEVWTVGMQLLRDVPDGADKSIDALVRDGAHLLAGITDLDLLRSAERRGLAPGLELPYYDGPARARLAEWLTKDSAANAALLLAANDTINAEQEPYGLARGPEAGFETAAVAEGLGAILRSLGFGLQRGRHADGLETLMQEYVDAKAGKKMAAREDLFDALTRFAEKLRSIALLDVLHEVDIEGARNPDENYTLALETVSQMILTQVDDLRAQEKHEERMKDRAKDLSAVLSAQLGEEGSDSSQIALRSSTKTTPAEVLAVLIDHLQTRKIILLERCADCEVKGKDTQALNHQVDCIDRALKAAYAYRSDFIYIRPASSYLRNAYPAPYLQPENESSWKNQLSAQGRRAMFGERTSADSREQHKRLAELDKRFWVNINRIRLAGTGDTTYAVVKDDVGNWYVKGYSSNVDQMMGTFQGLMAYSLQGAANAQDLADAAKIAGKDDKDPEPANPTRKSLLTSELVKVAGNEFEQAAGAAFSKLTGVIAGSKARAGKLWGADAELKSHRDYLLLAFELVDPATPELAALEGEDAAVGTSLKARIVGVRARYAALANALTREQLDLVKSKRQTAQAASRQAAVDGWAKTLIGKKLLWTTYEDWFAELETLRKVLEQTPLVVGASHTLAAAPTFADKAPATANALRSGLDATADKTLASIEKQEDALRVLVDKGQIHIDGQGQVLAGKLAAAASALDGDNSAPAVTKKKNLAQASKDLATLRQQVSADHGAHNTRLDDLEAAVALVKKTHTELSATKALTAPSDVLMKKAKAALVADDAKSLETVVEALRKGLETYDERLRYAAKVSAPEKN